MSHDEIIEKATQVLSTLTTCDGQPHATELHRRQARALSDAGLLARLLPTREEIAMAIAARHWDRESGDVEVWHDLTRGEREAVAENYLTWDSADAVLSLLKGQEV